VRWVPLRIYEMQPTRLSSTVEQIDSKLSAAVLIYISGRPLLVTFRTRNRIKNSFVTPRQQRFENYGRLGILNLTWP